MSTEINEREATLRQQYGQRIDELCKENNENLKYHAEVQAECAALRQQVEETKKEKLDWERLAHEHSAEIIILRSQLPENQSLHAQVAKLREALRFSHDAMLNWFSSEYADHPKTKLVTDALAETEEKP